MKTQCTICPLEGSHYTQFCSLLPVYQLANTVHECQYQTECSQIRESIELHKELEPIPWFNKHVNTSNKQTALQESESTNYVIGVMSDQLDYDALPEL
jgi:hypothetical protein